MQAEIEREKKLNFDRDVIHSSEGKRREAYDENEKMVFILCIIMMEKF
jgi:hypothetical protein